MSDERPRPRWLSLLLLALPGGIVVWLAWRLATDAPLELEVGGLTLFVTSWADLGAIALWVAVLAASVAAMIRRPRRWRLAALLVGLAVGAPLAAARGPATVHPEVVALESLDGIAPNGRRTLLVAIDGLSWKRLFPLVRRGELPHLAGLMEQGTYGVLHSYGVVRPSVDEFGYWSPVVWTTIATGVDAATHGIQDFGIEDEDGVAQLAATYHRKAPAFWNLFSALGGRVGVAGWWATWPAERINGIVASSSLGLRGYRQFGQQSFDDPIWVRDPRGLTWPESFRGTILDRLLPVDVEAQVKADLFDLETYPVGTAEERRTFTGIIWQDRLYKRIGRFMLTRRDFDLTAVYFEAPDYASHLFWRYMSAPDAFAAALPGVEVPAGFSAHEEIVDNVYRTTDRELGVLLGELDDDATVLVVSDHGFRTRSRGSRKPDHSPFGVFIARGPGIVAGRNLNLSLRGSLVESLGEPLSVFDVLPTLMYLHGLPVSLELPRSPQYRLFENEYLAANPVRTVAAYGALGADGNLEMELNPEDQSEYEERLRSLGYIN